MIRWLLELWHTMYVPRTGPFYDGATWGNVFVLAIVAPLGWAWSRTRFWPLDPLHRGLEHLHGKVDALRARHEELHERHDAHAEHLDRLGRSLVELHEKLDRLEERPGADPR